jgi:hypothetical protein
LNTFFKDKIVVNVKLPACTWRLEEIDACHLEVAVGDALVVPEG